jgi:hypothetical protein
MHAARPANSKDGKRSCASFYPIERQKKVRRKKQFKKVKSKKEEGKIKK